jgi:hypothetical protein
MRQQGRHSPQGAKCDTFTAREGKVYRCHARHLTVPGKQLLLLTQTVRVMCWTQTCKATQLADSLCHKQQSVNKLHMHAHPSRKLDFDG